MKSNLAGRLRAESKRAAPARGAGATRRSWSGRRAPIGLRRDEILRSVGNILRHSRLSSLTMQQIADELGITKGNLYYYFRDKQDILYQCHLRCMDISLEALREVRSRGESPAQKLRSLLTRHIGAILEDGRGSVLLTDLESLRPAQRQRYVERRDEFERGVRQLIEQGVKEREFGCGDVKLAGFAILGAINWIPKWYREDGSMSAKTIAAAMTDVLMRTLGPAAVRRRATVTGGAD